MKDNKGAVLAIMEKMKGSSGEKEEKETDSGMAKKGAMSAFMSAIKSDDAAAASKALSNFVDLCQDGGEY